MSLLALNGMVFDTSKVLLFFMVVDVGESGSPTQERIKANNRLGHGEESV